MAQVTLRINGYAHALSCADGEEEHLKAMGAEVDARIAALRQAGLAGGEARMLVVAALQLADELADAKRALGQGNGAPSTAQAELAATVAVLAARVGRVADRLEREAALETAEGSA
jgi:cell division protein ZapA